MELKELTNNTQEESSAELAFVIHLKNKTDEKIFNLDLFNYNYKEQQKVEYKSFYPDYDYLLRQLSGLRSLDNLNIKKIQLKADCEYIKFSVKQVQCEVELVWTALSGISFSIKKELDACDTLEKVEYNNVILNFLKPTPLTNQLQIKLDYLMPETALTVTIWYEKNAEE